MNASKNYGFLFLDGKSISRDIEICDAGFEECAPGHNYGPTVRNYYLFHLVLSGKGAGFPSAEKITKSVRTRRFSFVPTPFISTAPIKRNRGITSGWGLREREQRHFPTAL